jgi:hypothetical protein
VIKDANYVNMKKLKLAEIDGDQVVITLLNEVNE